MTHSDIYTKFMIEYDKANITSSYPSLTRYEVATILDKAYLALIAQKLTGNNPRKAALEQDIKAIEDLRPLFKQYGPIDGEHSVNVSNEYVYNIQDEDSLYYINSFVKINNSNTSVDGFDHTRQYVQLVSHEEAKPYMASSTNMPWVKNPVGYLEGDYLHVLVDSYDYINNQGDLQLTVTCISKPKKFAVGNGTSKSDYDFGLTKFELSDTMAEELINLAIMMSTEIVESSRLTTKLNTRPFEA